MQHRPLRDLLNSLKSFGLFSKADLQDDVDVLVTGITANSARCQDGFIFVAKPGASPGSKDGHDFIQQAIENGAKVIVVDDAFVMTASWNVVLLRSRDTKVALSYLCEAFFDFPSKKLKVVGITGTNGKTSTCFMLHSIFKAAGFCPKIMGTLGVGDPNDLQKQTHTTMEAEFLSETLHNLYTCGTTHVFMEVSSHALALGRVEAIHFHAVALTNITLDHLDFHRSFDAYTQAKMRLFSDLAQDQAIAVLPHSNPFKRHFDSLNLSFFGHAPDSDCYFTNAKTDTTGHAFDLIIDDVILPVEIPFFGQFHLLNATLSALLALRLGCDLGSIKKGLKNCPVIPGRLQTVGIATSRRVFVDFAHTPDALQLLLLSIRPLAPQKIILVFGCGGNRDREKRAKMGKIAQALADLVIVTDDNPRHEDPSLIRRDILSGVDCLDKFIEIGDRKKAIEYAVTCAKKSDVILIAGKGHESYQIYGDDQRPFSDLTVAQEALETLCQ